MPETPSWPGLLLNGNLLARFQRAFVLRVAVTPGIASLNPGLISPQPFRAAGLHAGGRGGGSNSTNPWTTTSLLLAGPVAQRNRTLSACVRV